jgi:RimJ/RimL family protein N-acetyltransferase
MALEAVWRDLRVREPSREEVVAAAGQLAAYYNDPHNSAMLAHEEALEAADVIEHYDHLWGDHGRPLWLEQDGRLIGDADLRHIDGGVAEVAIMIGERGVQGQGLGTRFGVLVHVIAFRMLGLARTYATIIPGNPASLRLFAKLGYVVDDSPEARAYVDEDDDVALSLASARFEELYGGVP